MQFTYQNTMLVSIGYIETIHCTCWWLNQVTCRRNGLIWHLWKLFSCTYMLFDIDFHSQMNIFQCFMHCVIQNPWVQSQNFSPITWFHCIWQSFCIPYLDTLAVELSSWDWQALLGRWPRLHEANNITSNFNKECHLSSLTN